MTRISTRAALCICCACGLWGCPRQHVEDAATSTAPNDFELPHIPASLATPEARADYLAVHYWDNFDFTDTTLISRPEITEQAFADFIDLLTAAPVSTADSALTRMMAASEADSAMFAHFTGLSEKYLYDPNSPLRNEELYIPVLQYLADSPHLDSLNKLRPRYQLEMALKNRPGDIATDFYYTSKSGKRSRMRQIEADYTILFFNNPDCEDCNRVKEYMDMSPMIGGRLREQAGQDKTGDVDTAGGKLAVLALYTEGDIPHWRNAKYPPGMINAYDAGLKITRQQSYDLKAMPTLYLLDKDKRVILKDASVEQIEMWLVEKRKNQTK
ncbi:DUF5106 domain-containing protein [Alistipes onderdonkii]|uniref:DUF5106 domain-containing protein n=1 Tax=Alistipes onderdonkii TaxID=328813 RepID=UPI001877314C|nr:DUF5106 domain-containing protein [Alistipes onderdonkii]MBE5047023.1 DUF5106 domain-containing protein [Alistipes onderdonkii]